RMTTKMRTRTRTRTRMKAKMKTTTKITTRTKMKTWRQPRGIKGGIKRGIKREIKRTRGRLPPQHKSLQTTNLRPLHPDCDRDYPLHYSQEQTPVRPTTLFHVSPHHMLPQLMRSQRRQICAGSSRAAVTGI